MGQRFSYFEFMRNALLLLLCIAALFFATGLVLQAVYGPSYGFLAGEDCWKPDGQGGWEKHGEPGNPAPDGPSREIPLLMPYLPIFLPALLLALFLFTPLSRRLEGPVRAGDSSSDDQADSEQESSLS